MATSGIIQQPQMQTSDIGQTATANPAAAAPGILGTPYKTYNGQQVMTGQNMMDQINSGAKLNNMDPQAYDKMLNPNTYGARWGLPDPTAGSAPTSTTAPTAPAAPTAPTGTSSTSASGASNGSTDVASWYKNSLGREADNAGLDYWNGRLASGGDPNALYSEFMSDAKTNGENILAPQTGSVTPGTSPTLPAPTAWNVTPDQTVQGQMTNMIDPNSPYYQAWATAGAQDAAARGFTGNSSIRSTGIMDSVMRNATPIATADASTVAKAAGYNADMPNQFALKSADMQQQSSLAQLSANTQKYMSNQSAETQKAVQQMSQTGQLAISQAHDANSTLIQNNQAASSAYTNYVAAIAQIDQNATMDAAAKQAAITTQTQVFNNAIAGLKAATPNTGGVASPLDISNVTQQVGGVDVSNILNFGG